MLLRERCSRAEEQCDALRLRLAAVEHARDELECNLKAAEERAVEERAAEAVEAVAATRSVGAAMALGTRGAAEDEPQATAGRLVTAQVGRESALLGQLQAAQAEAAGLRVRCEAAESATAAATAAEETARAEVASVAGLRARAEAAEAAAKKHKAAAARCEAARCEVEASDSRGGVMFMRQMRKQVRVEHVQSTCGEPRALHSCARLPLA